MFNVQCWKKESVLAKQQSIISESGMKAVRFSLVIKTISGSRSCCDVFSYVLDASPRPVVSSKQTFYRDGCHTVIEVSHSDFALVKRSQVPIALGL